MRVSAKYITEFTIKGGRIQKSRILREEFATEPQKVAIAASKPILASFLRTRVKGTKLDGLVSVRTSYVETDRGLEISFKL